MQYETIFDIDNALPGNWSGLWVGLAIIVLFLMARFRQQQLESPGVVQAIADFLPRLIWPRFLRRWLQPLVQLLALSIIAFAVVLAPRWRWGVAIGALIMAQTLWQLGSSFNEILSLRNAENVQVIEGKLTKVDHYVTKRARREYINIASRHFDYGEHDPGTPYSLVLASRSIAAGQQVRLGVVGDRIIRVERQLCLVYQRCTVSYFLSIRYESEL